MNTQFSFSKVKVAAGSDVSFSIDENGQLNIASGEFAQVDTMPVVTTRRLKTKVSPVMTAVAWPESKTVKITQRGQLSSILNSTNLAVGQVRKIRTAMTDSAIRKNGYANGIRLNISKSGSLYTILRVA